MILKRYHIFFFAVDVRSRISQNTVAQEKSLMFDLRALKKNKKPQKA
jgi:hypothetical protein